MYFKLNATVILDGLDISNYIIELKRNCSLCNIVQTFTLFCDKTLLDFLDDNSIELKPSNSVIIYEFGKKKLTGNVRSVTRSRKPDYELRIDGTDKYKYAKDYFIDDDFQTSNGETVPYWTQTLLTLAGLNFTLDSAELSARTVAPGVEFKLRTVDDALMEVTAYASAYVYADTSGTIHLQKGARNSGLLFSTGTTLFSGALPQDLIGGNILKGTKALSDDNTRNVAKVWGFKGDTVLLPGESPFITSEQSVNLDMPVDKTVLYSSNYIQTQEEADRLAGVIITDLGKFDSIKTLEVVGNPDIALGKTARIDADLETIHIIETSIITGIDTDLSKDGYTMQVTLDEFCPKFAGWSKYSVFPIVYAGTAGQGIYSTEDLGALWKPTNSGLPIITGSNSYVDRLGFDSTNNGMAIINKGLYHYDGSVWHLKALPVLSGLTLPFGIDTFPKGIHYSVALDNVDGIIYLLTTQQVLSGFTTLVSGLTNPKAYISYLHTSIDYGSSWTSEVIHKEPAADKNDYNYRGIDLSAGSGYPYILVGKETAGDLPIPFHWLRMNWNGCVEYSRMRDTWHLNRAQYYNNWNGSLISLETPNFNNFSPIWFPGGWYMTLQFPTLPLTDPTQILNVGFDFSIANWITPTSFYPYPKISRIGFIYGIQAGEVGDGNPYGPFGASNLPYASPIDDYHPQGQFFDTTGGGTIYTADVIAGHKNVYFQLDANFIDIMLQGYKLKYDFYFSRTVQITLTSIYQYWYLYGEDPLFTKMYYPYDTYNLSYNWYGDPLPEHEDGWGVPLTNMGNNSENNIPYEKFPFDLGFGTIGL